MTRRRWWAPLAVAFLPLAVVALLGGCGLGLPGLGGDGSDRLHEQARDALARYEQAVRDAGGAKSFVPVGDPTGQLGDWEPENGANKQALLVGLFHVATTLPQAPEPTATVVWDSGPTEQVALISAEAALAPGSGPVSDCLECVPLEITGAEFTMASVETTRGSASAPVWMYSIKGTAVRVTRIAVARSVTVTPPSWDSYNAPGGIAIASAATTTSSDRRLTVSFTGAPYPASRPCGADYTAEAVESALAIVVIVTAHPHAANETCPSVGAPRDATVDLAAPLGERAVLEVQQGLPVPLTIAA